MLPFLSSNYGNPASTHPMGRMAKGAVEKARESIASLLDCAPTEIFFTSGATESNNLVLRGVTGSGSRNRIVTSAIEHKSVLGPCARLERNGFQVQYLPVDPAARISLDAAAEIIDGATLLVSIQAANNEVGTIHAVERFAEIAHEKGALFHCDATQALGKIPFSVTRAGVDFASFSGHKVYGPKGIGILFARNGTIHNALKPISSGGAQERGLRPGTLNVPGIVGLAKAAELVVARLASDQLHIRKLHELFENRIRASGVSVRFNGDQEARLPGTINMTIPGIPADMLIANLPEICISNGAACTAGAMSQSHVLLAMGGTQDEAECTVRIGIGRYNSESEIEQAIDGITHAVLQLAADIRSP